ncbi:zinc finger protein 503 [Nilaparvata lugens]|uniref:zinc finger protein 503 n=1 Tax=Nilaparvata lugens TaxID=108931 RepID=UPI00193DEFE4|nr:zinc finger protein 503 [Nilaparvata lugens]
MCFVFQNEISFNSFGSDAKTYPREGWAEHDVVEIPLSDSTLDNLIKKGSSEDIKLGAVSIVGMLKHPSPPGPHDMAAAADDDDDDFHGSRYRRPALITGVSVRSKRSPSSASVGAVSPAVRAMNDVNQNQATTNHLDIMKVMDASDSSSTSSFSSSGGFQYDRQLLLVVYDFHYESSGRAPPREGGWGGGGGGGGPGGSGSGINNVAADGNGNGSLSWSANQSGGATKKVGSGTGTGTSASRPENNIQEIFLSKLFYCQNSLMDDVDALPPDPQLHYDSTKSSIHLSEAFPSQSPSIAVVVPPVGGGTFNASAMGLDVFPPSTSSSVNLPPPSTPPFSNAIKVSVSNRELKGAQGAAGSGGNGSYKSEGGSGVETTPKEPASVQCVTVDSLGRHSAITGIHPTKDGRHLLVTLGSDPDEDDDEGEGGGSRGGGVFVIYGLVFDGPVVSVRENPLCWREFQSEPKQVGISIYFKYSK